MTDLGPIEEDVLFAWGPAASLSAQLRRAARMLDNRIPRLKSAAHHAKEDFRGVYARKFDHHMSICTGDAAKFSAAMEKAAEALDQLSQMATEEQQRREIAREWQRRHEEWERKRGDGLLQTLKDLDGTEEPKPPDLPEIKPHPLLAKAPASGGRS
jgi:hypothetical protein